MARQKRKRRIRKVLLALILLFIVLPILGYLFTPLKMIPKIFFGEPTKELTQAQRVENFEYIYQIFDEHYPFFQLKQINWRALHDAYLPKIKAAPTCQAYWDTLEIWLSKLHDQHVRLRRQGENLASMFNFEKRWYSPIDLAWTPSKVVIAYASDPRLIGVQVLSVNGREIKVYLDSLITVDRATFSKFRTDEIRKKQALQFVLRSKKKNSRLKLTLRFPDGNVGIRSFKRSIIEWKWLQKIQWENAYANAYLADIDGIDWRIRYGRLKNANVGYIKLGTLMGLKQRGSFMNGLGFFLQRFLFKRSPIQENLEKAILALSGVDAVIVDLRGNSGGNESIGHWLASIFIRTDSLLIKFSQFRDGPKHTDFTPKRPMYLKRMSESWNIPVVVLIDNDVISSAEGTAAAFCANPYATLVGEATRGSTANPMIRDLPHGGSVRVSRWIAYTHDGSAIEDKGIPPDVEVIQPLDAFSAQRDYVLEHAIQILERKISSKLQ